MKAQTRFPFLFMLCVLTVLACAMVAAAYLPVTPDGKITLTDYGYRDWGPELVHYSVDPAKFRAGKCRLLDMTGMEIPCQLDGTTLTFVATLPKGKSVSFMLTPDKPHAATTLAVKQEKAWLEIGNEFYTLRLPPVGKNSYKQPIEAATATPPFLQWQPAGGPWMGGARFVTERKVKSVAFTLTQNGPACAVYEARYQFEPAGEYVCRVTVAPGIDRAEFTEEFDFGSITPGQDFLLLELQRDNVPAGGIGICAGEGGEMRRTALNAYLDPKIKANANSASAVGGVGATPLPPKPQPDMVLLDKITPAMRWSGLIGGVEMRGTAPENQDPAHFAVLPMHVGSWRRAMALTMWYQQKEGVVVALPISVRHLTWYDEVTDDISPFSTHEHDTGLKASYGRRQWALYFGKNPENVQKTAGHIGLDNFKEWVLDWPEKADAATYPRAWFTKADVARLKKSLDQHPDKAVLSSYYVFSGKTEDAVRNAQNATNGILSQLAYMGNWNVYGLSHYRQAQSLGGCGSIAEDALACPELPADLRMQLRRTIAVAAYQIADPDINPRGAGVHLGNNNMPINRTCTLLYFAALLPDHPLYQYWMDKGTDFIKFKLGSYIAPDGVPLECPLYSTYGPVRFLCDATHIIHNTGGPELAKMLAANLAYLGNLSMPDVRYDGWRILPGMGNSSNKLESLSGIYLSDVERVNPELAGKLQMLYQKAWPEPPISKREGNTDGTAFRYFPDIPQQNASLTTTVMPTYGVAFHAHFGSPDETGLLFRIGTNWGHWDTDPLNVILYSKGAPLTPGTGYQYIGGALTDNNAVYHNQLKVGKYDLQEIFGRVDNYLLDYGFGPHADYAVGSRYYPPEVFGDTAGETSWNRHVLFLKSARPDGANYAVMHDTLTGQQARPTWWTWMNLGDADKISVDGAAFTSLAVNKRLPEAEMPVKRGQVVELATDFGASTWCWFSEPRAFRIPLTAEYDVTNAGRLALPNDKFPKLPGTEKKTILEGVGAAGQDWLYILFPRKNGEATPAVSKLADSALKITTAESTDYAFVSDTPLNIDRDGVIFTGKAGSVRVFADRVVFCMNAGDGKIGYHGCIFAGAAPFERTVTLAELKAGETKVNDTYVKAWLTIDLGNGLTATGEGPFTAKLDGQSIRITTEGRARVIYVTKPAWTDWVQYMVDGEEHMACWTDYPSSGWGAYKNTKLIALTVLDGKHELLVKDYVYPLGWTREFTPTIKGALLAP